MGIHCHIVCQVQPDNAKLPGRVFPGKKMPGQMGNEQITISNQLIYKVDVENNLIMIKGAVPGSKGAFVIIRPAKATATQAKGKSS